MGGSKDLDRDGETKKRRRERVGSGVGKKGDLMKRKKGRVRSEKSLEKRNVKK